MQGREKKREERKSRTGIKQTSSYLGLDANGNSLTNWVGNRSGLNLRGNLFPRHNPDHNPDDTYLYFVDNIQSQLGVHKNSTTTTKQT